MFGLKVTLATEAAMILMSTLAELLEPVTVIVASTSVDTTAVVTGKVAEVAPSGTVTVAGTVARESDELTSRTIPAGAGASIVTVPVAVPPLAMSVGVITKLVTAGARTKSVSVAVLKTPS